MAGNCIGIGRDRAAVPRLPPTMSSTNSNQALVGFGPLQAFIGSGLQRVGLPEADAQRVAGLMAQADLQGSDGHGVIRLVPYIKRIRAGGINVTPKIRIEQERAAM